jgi:hypothetical protein
MLTEAHEEIMDRATVDSESDRNDALKRREALQQLHLEDDDDQPRKDPR